MFNVIHNIVQNQSGLRQYLSSLSSTNDALSSAIPAILSPAVPAVVGDGPAPTTGNSNKKDNKLHKLDLLTYWRAH